MVNLTRMCMADCGDMIIFATGVSSFWDLFCIDRGIRAFGYQKRLDILRLVKESQELSENHSVAAHLIHGSSVGRFKITYAVQHLSEEEIKGVYFDYLPYLEAVAKYDPQKLRDGYNMVDGEKV